MEALAELESMARDAVRRYQGLSADDLRWVLVEARDTLLPGLHPKLASFTEGVLRKRGVELYLGTRLESCVDKVVVLSGGARRAVPSETIVWTAGQRANPDVEASACPPTSSGGSSSTTARRWWACPGCSPSATPPGCRCPEGGFAPMTAQHAVRQAKGGGGERRRLARESARRIRFEYRNRGLAVTLGKWQGTAQVRRFTFTGPLAWWMGRSYHLLMIPGLARKARVVSDWTISLLFRRDVSQLGQLGKPTPLEPAPAGQITRA